MNLPKLTTITCWGLTKSVNAYIMKPKNITELQQCIIIGKNHSKFPEADALIKLGGVTSVSQQTEFSSTVNTLITDNSQRKKQGLINKNYIEKNKGAVIQILDYIRIT